jgi:AAA+ superfamily predicted ATPase
MEPDLTVLASLRKAVEAMPDDVPLRVHLATLLMRAGQRDEAIRHVGAVLQRDPGNGEALALLLQQPPAPHDGTGAPGQAVPPETDRPPAAPGGPDEGPGAPRGPDEGHDIPGGQNEGRDRSGGQNGPAGTRPQGRDGRPAPEFDWSQAESELREVLPPMFVGGDESETEAPAEAVDSFDAERSTLKLADVAGMTQVKERLEAAFLAPMRNPELRKLYGKSLRGGLLLYGPPGCGKTFIARAVAGELGARFMAVSFADIIDMFVGQSERNIHELFEIARRNAPCVLFLDEVDAIGQKRSQLRNTPMRSAVNQLLLELDDVDGGNDGVFLLAATNHPWDVDSALRRPGRFYRTLLVLPPDGTAREAVFRYHLRERPVAGVNLARLAKLTDGYSGADIAHICETASERALMDSIHRGEARMIGQPDLEGAIAEVKPSLGAWFDTARNVALFANEGGAYDDLANYLKKRRLI